MSARKVICCPLMPARNRWMDYPLSRRSETVCRIGRPARGQHENGGYLTTELMDAVAEYLEMPPIAVLRGGDLLLDVRIETGRSTQYFGLHQYFLHAARRRRHSGAYREKLGIRLGESTADGKFF